MNKKMQLLKISIMVFKEFGVLIRIIFIEKILYHRGIIKIEKIKVFIKLSGIVLK
jgi:hypothetical protein